MAPKGSEVAPPLTRRTTFLLLLLVLAAAALLRGYGIGAHPGSNWDEGSVLQPARQIAGGGDWRPHTMFWGSLAPYWAGVFVRVSMGAAAGLQALTGKPRLSLDEPGDLFLLARTSMALASVLTVWLTFLIGRKLHGAASGLTAAAMVAGARVSIVKAQEATADTVLTLMATLTLWLALRARESPTLRRFLLAGAGIGLAVGSKYNGWVAAVPVVVAALTSLPPVTAAAWLAGAAGVSLGAFFLTNPYAAREFGYFLDQIGALRGVYERKGMPASVSQLRMFPVFWEIAEEWMFGRLGAVLALGGATLALIRRRADELIVASFVVGYVVWYSLFLRLPQVHNYLIVVPGLAVMAAAASWRASTWAAARLAARPRLARWAAISLPLAATIPLLATSASRQREVRAPSTAEYVGVWVEQSLPPGARVLCDRTPMGRRGRLLAIADLASIADLREADLLRSWDYLVVDLDAAAATGRERPLLAARYRRILLDARLEPLGQLQPGKGETGPSYALFRIDRDGWVAVEEQPVPLLGFRFDGEGNHVADNLWVRGPGSTARAPLPFALVPGEGIDLEARAGSDDTRIAGSVPELRLGTADGGARVAVDCNRTFTYHSGSLPGRFPPPEVEFACDGPGEDRVFTFGITAHRLVAATSLTPALVERRVHEQDLVRRAGL